MWFKGAKYFTKLAWFCKIELEVCGLDTFWWRGCSVRKRDIKPVHLHEALNQKLAEVPAASGHENPRRRLQRGILILQFVDLVKQVRNYSVHHRRTQEANAQDVQAMA
jgi:hypothetical protein